MSIVFFVEFFLSVLVWNIASSWTAIYIFWPFPFSITSRIFVIMSIIWILFVQYITYTTLDGSGKDWSLYFQTWTFRWNDIMFSCRCILNILTYSLAPFNIKHAFTLQFLAVGFILLPRFLNFSRSRRDLPLFQESSFILAFGPWI